MFILFNKSSFYFSFFQKQILIQTPNNFKKKVWRTIQSLQLKKQKKRIFAINNNNKQVYFLGKNVAIYNLLNPSFLKLNSNSKNLQKLNFLIQAKKTSFEQIIYKTKKLSIDWHSKDLLGINQGIWFSNCFRPFSTRKYWWILLPSQSLLFRLRWETLSKLHFYNKTQKQNGNVLKVQQLNWFNEKPLYIYWIIPFFGCLNLVSVAFSKDIGHKLQLIHVNKAFLNENKIMSYCSNVPSLNLTTVSWETFNYLSYKKTLLDLSFKFLKNINCYHDSIIYEVAPSWFNFLQEQYLGIYSENERSNILRDFGIQNKKVQKKINFSNQFLENAKNADFSDNYKKMLRTFKNMQLWWNQESFEKNFYLRKVVTVLTENKKEKTELINHFQKPSLVEYISQRKKITNLLFSFSHFSKNEVVWNKFSIKKSKIKWCWYKLSINNIPFYSKNNKNLFYKSNLPCFLWKKNVGNLNYQLNLVERNCKFYKNFLKKTTVNKIFSSLSGFSELEFMNLNFDEFAQKILIETISFPLNYLSMNHLSNKQFVEPVNPNFFSSIEQPNKIKKSSNLNFSLKKVVSPLFLKKNCQLDDFLLNKVSTETRLRGIHSHKRYFSQQTKKSFFSKFFFKTIENKTGKKKLIFAQKSTSLYNLSKKISGNPYIPKDLSSLSISIKENKQFTKYSFSWLNFIKNKELSNFKESNNNWFKNKEIFKKFGILNRINQVEIFDTYPYYYNKSLDDVYKNFLKASFIYNNLFYKLFLNSRDYILRQKNVLENNILQSRFKIKPLLLTDKKKGSEDFLINSENLHTNFLLINLSKKTLNKSKSPVIMSGYFFPEKKNSNFSRPVAFIGNCSPIKKIKRINGFIKVIIPPLALALTQQPQISFKNWDFIQKDFLKRKLSNNLNTKIKTNLLKSESCFLLPNCEVKKNQISHFKNYPFYYKDLNFDNITYIKNYLFTPKSFIFYRGQKPIELPKRIVFDLTKNFSKKNNLKFIHSELELKKKLKSNFVGYRFKYIGNLSFYWYYFKNFYGSFNVLKPFNDIFYLTNFYSFFSNNFKKIGIHEVFPGNNFLYQKWYPRKREGFFYKRINKLNIKNLQLTKKQHSITKVNSIVELLWGFRAKYKLDEVLQYQKSKYYQSKKAQQTTNDQNENQTTNNSKITLQTLTKSLIKRKRYKKYMRFEVLSKWLRDILYFRQMSRKVFLTKKDSYLINISQLMQQSKKGRFDQKFFHLKDTFSKLFTGNAMVFNAKPSSKLIIKSDKKKIINLAKMYFNKKSFFESRKFNFYKRWINNKKLFIVSKRGILFKALKLRKKSFYLENFDENLYYNKYSQQNSLNRNFSYNLNAVNFYSSSLLVQKNLKIILEPLKSNNSNLNILQNVSDSSSSNLKKLDLNNSNNRFLKISKFRNIISFIKELNEIGFLILKDLNTLLINILKKFGLEVEIRLKMNCLFHLVDKPSLNLKSKFLRKLECKEGAKNSCIHSNEKKAQKHSNAFYFLNKSSTQIFEKSKKLIRILNLKPMINDECFNKKYIFKNYFIDCFKTNVKHNWIKKIYKNSIIMKINGNNEKSLRLVPNKIFTKNNSQINYFTSILTNFKNFSSFFVLCRNQFQIRRDYLLLSYIYIDYLGALINSLINNCIDWIVEGTIFSPKNSKFVLFNYFEFFNMENHKIYNNFFQKNSKFEPKKIYSSVDEKVFLGSNLYKNNIIRPKWSFFIMNHLKSYHFALYEKLVQTQKKENTNDFILINKNKPNSTVLKFDKGLNNLISIQTKELKQKKIINQNKLDLQLNNFYSINLFRENPTVVFYHSMVNSYTNDSNYFSNLKTKYKTQFYPIIDDSSVNNNLYIKYKNQNSQKKILFLKKQHKFQKFYKSVLWTLVDYNNHKKTKKENLKVKLRRNIGLFKTRILNKKIKIYNGKYLPTLQFVNVSLLINSNSILNQTKNQLSKKNFLSRFLEGSLTLLISHININNFWLCTIIFHVCLIFTLLNIYKSSFHFCIKSLYSTLFVLNKYFIYVKYRIHRLLKYIYQSNFQSIIDNFQQKYLEKHIFSFYFILNNIVILFFKRNSAFLISSRFKKFNQFQFMRNQKEDEKVSFNSSKIKLHRTVFSSVFTSLKKTSNSEFIRFFHYLIKQNQNLKQFKKLDNYFLENKNFSSKFFSQLSGLCSFSKNITNKIKLKNFRFIASKAANQELETLGSQAELGSQAKLDLKILKQKIGLTKIKKAGSQAELGLKQSQYLKFTFQVLRWNMFLTLLIGESEILGELQPYKEMHWYFLKRFPVFLRTAAGKDFIGLVDYQADEKIRLIKQKIRQTIMILYLRSRKYESKLQNQNINEKTNKSFLKNRTKVVKWSKDSIMQKLTKKDLNLNVSIIHLGSQAELGLKQSANYVEKIDKDFGFIDSKAANPLETNKSFNLAFIEIFSKLVKKSITSFYFPKHKKSIRKIAPWKSILTFLGKLSFISRYAKLNKRFRNSIILFSNPLVFFGPMSTILIPYLIKSVFLVFETRTQYTKSFLNNTSENLNYLQKTGFNRKNQKFDQFYMKNIFSYQLDIKKSEYCFNRNFFAKSLKSKLIKIYNLTNPFFQEKQSKLFTSNLSEYCFEKHVGNLNLYIRQKIQNFKNFKKTNDSQVMFSNNNLLNLASKNIAPNFEFDFLTNCLKFLNKYDRIYLNLNKINLVNKNSIKKPWLIKNVIETNFNTKNQILLTLFPSKDMFYEIGITDTNLERSRFINFDTFDPKLRYYRFYTNFSKVLSDVGGFGVELDAHQQFGPLICKVYAGLFLKQRAKNYLLVARPNKTESLLFIVQALAGEMGMKLFLEDAKRLQRIGRRGINKATKRLEKLFDIAQANTPCLIFIEDIHVIGSKTKMIKVDEEQEDEEILMRSLLSKLIYRKYHKNKSLRETFIDQNFYTGGFSIQRRRSLKPSNPIPKDLVLYQLTRRRAFSNYFLNSNNKLTRINTKLFMRQKLSPTFTTNAVLIWKLFKSKIATPNKSIKEAPWVHIPVDALRSIHPLTYSIRVKIAKITLLAIFTMGTRLRLVKDLIRLFEKTYLESQKNFVVFATTTKLSYMDPSLRRPGRLEETIHLSSLTSVSTLVRASTYQSQLYNFKTYLKNLPGFSFTFNFIDNTIFSSRLNLREWSVINYLAEDAYYLGFSSFNTNVKNINFLTKNLSKNSKKVKNQKFFSNIKEKLDKNQLFSQYKFFLKKQHINLTERKLISLGNQKVDSNFLQIINWNSKLKKQRMTSYESLTNGSTSDYWQLIFSNIILQRKKGLFNFNIPQKSIIKFNSFSESVHMSKNFINQLWQKSYLMNFFSTYRQNKSFIFALLGYTQVGQSLVSFLPVFSFFRSPELKKKAVFFDPDQITNIQLWPFYLKSYEFKPQNIFLNRRRNLKVYFLRFFSAKVGEFLFTNPIEWDNMNTLGNSINIVQSLTKTGFLNSINDIQPNWSLAHSYIMNLITTSCLYSKSPLITKLLRIEHVTKPRQKQFFESLTPGILFEYSNFHYRTFLNKNLVSMENNLNQLQNQKFMLNNQGRPLRKYVKLSVTNRLWLFRILFTELGSLNDISLRPTSMNYYYQNKIALKQKLKICSYQWLNWHLRKPLDQLEEIQDIAYFPCAEKYYNPRNRRWMITNGYWGYWFTFDKFFYYNLYEEYIFDSFYKVYNHLDKNRELLDNLVQILITQETILENELILSFKRYAI